MNTITLILVVFLANGQQSKLTFENAFADAPTCTEFAIETGTKIVADPKYTRVNYYCVKRGIDL